MKIIDYANSYMTFFTSAEQGENIARIQLDASCSVTGWSGRAPQEFHLIAPCRSERMYRDGQLFQMPNYEFCGIFAEDQLALLRTHWTSDEEEPELAIPNERFDHVDFHLTELTVEKLTSNKEIVAATLANRRLVATTELSSIDSSISAVLQYPIKTMNVTRDPARFQVDTGPLILPDLDTDAGMHVGRFSVAHVVYCDETRAEFVLRKPHNVASPKDPEILVTDYSESVVSEARNTIWAETQ